MTGVLIPWTIAVGLQTVRDVRVYGRPPVPAEFVASGLVFGALSVLSGAQPGVANVLAWGFLLALGLQAWEDGRGITQRRTTEQEVEGA